MHTIVYSSVQLFTFVYNYVLLCTIYYYTIVLWWAIVVYLFTLEVDNRVLPPVLETVLVGRHGVAGQHLGEPEQIGIM